MARHMTRHMTTDPCSVHFGPLEMCELYVPSSSLPLIFLVVFIFITLNEEHIISTSPSSSSSSSPSPTFLLSDIHEQCECNNYNYFGL